MGVSGFEIWKRISRRVAEACGRGLQTPYTNLIATRDVYKGKVSGKIPHPISVAQTLCVCSFQFSPNIHDYGGRPSTGRPWRVGLRPDRIYDDTEVVLPLSPHVRDCLTATPQIKLSSCPDTTRPPVSNRLRAETGRYLWVVDRWKYKE